mmetsp:Transcript_25414/g.73516  ORF Transcript_25414/g.73516 Transcript_25414/m.73516 type:complete len:554 (+) Transcript_25414:81-1742(+)
MFAASAGIGRSGLLVHPAVPLKLTGYAHRMSSQIRHRHVEAVLREQRQATNIARLYARRILELASVAAATKATTTKLESAMIKKPEEWGTVNLEEKRRLFGESISTLGETKLERVWAAGSRICNLTLLASPLAVLVPLAYLGGSESRAAHYAWEYAIWSIEKAGPTFIKLTQWATTRNDLFPQTFVSKFARLQDETRGHTWKETERILEASFGKDVHNLFEFDEEKPIGSGCIAQVYKAKLKKATDLYPVGTDVAVKVCHPHILDKVCLDFYLMNKVTALLEQIPRINLDYLSMKDSVDQFRDIMLPQLDLRVEARNLTRFRRDFADDNQVAFPAPIPGLTRMNVLVESYVNGKPVLEFMKTAKKEDNETLATIGLSTVMKMIFLNDFVHGDLHPGNIIIDRNEKARGKPLRMNMIDCGLVVEMGENEHVNLVKILGAFIKRDGYLAGQLMVDTAKKCQATEMDVDMFCRGIQKICDDDLDNNFLESVGDYLADICYLACVHKVKLEAAFINAALACEIMEGLASSLYPDMAVQRIALPMVAKAELMHRLHLK